MDGSSGSRTTIDNTADMEKFLLDQSRYALTSYYKNQRFVKMRPILVSYATLYTYEVDELQKPITAATIQYADLFLSKNQKIPLVIPGESVKTHFQIFVFACATMACTDADIWTRSLRSIDFVRQFQVAEKWHVWTMMDRIRSGLSFTGQPRSPWEGLPLLFKMVTNDVDFSSLPKLSPWEILVTIRKDIRFTDFSLCTLLAAALLVTSWREKPELHQSSSEKIFTVYTHFFDSSDVDRCFEAMKEHIIVDEALANPIEPRVLRHIPVSENSEGRKPLVHVDLKGLCEEFNEFDTDWLEAPTLV